MKWSSPSLGYRSGHSGVGEFRVSGFSLPRKLPTLATMKTVAKMGHPVGTSGGSSAFGEG
jgi:hypothetical protein